MKGMSDLTYRDRDDLAVGLQDGGIARLPKSVAERLAVDVLAAVDEWTVRKEAAASPERRKQIRDESAAIAAAARQMADLLPLRTAWIAFRLGVESWAGSGADTTQLAHARIRVLYFELQALAGFCEGQVRHLTTSGGRPSKGWEADLISDLASKWVDVTGKAPSGAEGASFVRLIDWLKERGVLSASRAIVRRVLKEKEYVD